MVNKRVKSRYNKTYYYKNRKKMLAYLSAKVKCPCGCSVSRGNMKSHLKTEKHKKHLSTINQNNTPVSKC